jgi:hypothetical protein
MLIGPSGGVNPTRPQGFNPIKSTRLINMCRWIMPLHVLGKILESFTLEIEDCFDIHLAQKMKMSQNLEFPDMYRQKPVTRIRHNIFIRFRPGLWGIVEIIQFILSDKHLDGVGRSLRRFLDKVKEWHFDSTSNEVIWPKKFQILCTDQKVPFWQFFRQGRYGRALLVLPSRIPHRISKNIFALGADES